ncbi:hypothetical protein B0H10DRAFT_1305321 [Mycena sp. CBHHK59/15]|nr:hypothetical protein B0H10DRAFT_1305321 [Mycena sp. CBHHK59/15]
MDATTAVVTAQGSINEGELKRKTRSLERAKANHLLRQLQLRLQYARLKVDHGWEKQCLNEIPLDHSRQAGHGYPSTTVLTSQLDPKFVSQQPQLDEKNPSSSLSFKLGPSPAEHHSITTEEDALKYLDENPSNSDLPSLAPNEPTVHSQGGSTSPHPPSNTASQAHVPAEAVSPARHSIHPLPNLVNPWLKLSGGNAPTFSTAMPQGPPASTSLSPTRYSSQISPASKAKVLGTATALTYDSFWSSVSGSDPNGAGQMSPDLLPTVTPVAMTVSKQGKGQPKVFDGSIAKRKSTSAQWPER